MVRECRPPARDPASAWLGRRSMTATSTLASASSPANMSPVGPPPAITTPCSVIATPATSLHVEVDRHALPTVVLVVAAEPDLPRLPLITSLGRPIKDRVVAHQELHSAPGCRVGV